MPKVPEGVARMFTEDSILWESAVGQQKESTVQDKENAGGVGSAQNTAPVIFRPVRIPILGTAVPDVREFLNQPPITERS